MVYISKNENDTIEIGKKIVSDLLKNNDMDIINIVMVGELGTGKTKFTEGVLSLINMEKEISSPTFTILNEYEGNFLGKKTYINHFDVYRLEDSDEFIESGLLEKLEEKSDGKVVNIIEWGRIIEDIIPKPYYEVKIEKIYEENNNGEEFRKIELGEKC